MKFIVISDTHGLHHDLGKLPEGDVIIHAGDFSGRSKKEDVEDFLNWYSKLPFKTKLLIAGNHDFLAARAPAVFESLIPSNIIYLNDAGCSIEKWKVWGSPVQPDLVGWAFGKGRGKEIRYHWNLIPPDIDILITHTPPKDILDKSTSGRSLGCEELKRKMAYIKPKVHVFGHVHASYGKINMSNILYINGSNIKSNVGIVNEPITFELF